MARAVGANNGEALSAWIVHSGCAEHVCNFNQRCQSLRTGRLSPTLTYRRFRTTCGRFINAAKQSVQDQPLVTGDAVHQGLNNFWS